MKEKVINRFTIVTLLLAFAFMLGGCVVSPPEEGIGSGDVTLRIGTRSGDDDESLIKNGRLMIYRAYSKTLEVNVLETGDPIVFEEPVRTGEIHIYLIANELPEWDLGNTYYSPLELKALLLNYSQYPSVSASAPIPMVGIYESVTLKEDGSMSMGGQPLVLTGTGAGTVNRLYSKVLLDINAPFSELPGGEPIELMSVEVRHMPRQAYFAPRKYQGASDSDYFDGASATLETGVNYFETAKDGSPGFNGQFAFYVPEYLASDAAHRMYLQVTTRLAGNPSVTMKYRLPLGNGMTKGLTHMNGSQAGADDFDVSRNTQYIYTVNKITSYGDFDGIEVLPEVKAWDMNTSPVNPKNRELNVSATSVVMPEHTNVRIYFSSDQEEVFVNPILNYKKYYYNNGSWSLQYSASAEPGVYLEGISGGNLSNFVYDYNTATKRGTGYIDLVYTSAITLELDVLHTIQLRLSANGLEREIFIQNEVVLNYAYSQCLGTFHRLGETGERIVRGGNRGEWSARVLPGKGDDFIRLSTELSQDPYIFTDNPGDPEDYPVEGNLTSVSGEGNIYFRVGLTETASNNRYGTIELTWNYGTQVSYIYVRQGEYPVRLGGVYWAAYNVGSPNSFVEYPTQMGKLYQWGMVVPYSPTAAGSPMGWSNRVASTFEQTACPSGYRHPKSTWGNSWSGSQVTPENEFYSLGFRQNRTADESFRWGYYADGFYDRHKLYGDKREALPDSDDIAVRGVLIGGTGSGTPGPTLFIPYTHIRSRGSGTLEKFGIPVGVYHSGTMTSYYYENGGNTTVETGILWSGFNANDYLKGPGMNLRGANYVEGPGGTVPQARAIRCVQLSAS